MVICLFIIIWHINLVVKSGFLAVKLISMENVGKRRRLHIFIFHSYHTLSWLVEKKDVLLYYLMENYALSMSLSYFYYLCI